MLNAVADCFSFVHRDNGFLFTECHPEGNHIRNDRMRIEDIHSKNSSGINTFVGKLSRILSFSLLIVRNGRNIEIIYN